MTTKKKTCPPKFATREEWLVEAVFQLRPLFDEIEAPDYPRIRTSCGWPKSGGGRGADAIGQCWHGSCSGDETFEIFISPELEESVRVLDILVHELVHAVDRNESGHRGAFKRYATAIGLEGKMTATHAGEALTAQLEELSAKLGAYPHRKLTRSASNKKPNSRWVKVSCTDCDYILRGSRTTLERATPICPICHEEMKS